MQLSWLYPNSSAAVNIRVANTSDQAFIKLRGGPSLLARVEALAEIYIQTDRSRDHILTVNAVSSVYLMHYYDAVNSSDEDYCDR